VVQARHDESRLTRFGSERVPVSRVCLGVAQADTGILYGSLFSAFLEEKCSREV
jgi:hypothetical protein